MSVLSKLASALGRRDEVPNQELARRIAQIRDAAAVGELVDNLANKSKDIRYDCIKVLYEAGRIHPDLIADHADRFLPLLQSKDNRMQWGAMTALAEIVREKPGVIFEHLPAILDAAAKGSVITKDQAVNILIHLCKNKDTAAHAFPLLIEQLAGAATNQLPMYAENTAPIVEASQRAIFIQTLRARLPEMDRESKIQRIEKVIRKISRS